MSRGTVYTDGVQLVNPREFHRFKFALSQEQCLAIDLYLKGHNLFVTGSAGTGKSVVIGEIQALEEKMKGQLAVTSTMGLSSLEIGGVTIHSYSKMGIADKPMEELVQKAERSMQLQDLWNKLTDHLIIDEISLLSPDYFQKLIAVISTCHEQKTHRRTKIDYKGTVIPHHLQFVFVGDFAQLPPVQKIPYDENDDDAGPQNKMRFVFQLPEWRQIVQKNVVLHKTFRQKDQEFVDLLNRFRFATHTTADLELLASRLNATLDTKFSKLEPTTLFTRRNDVRQRNEQKLKALPLPEESFSLVSGYTRLQLKDNKQDHKLWESLPEYLQRELNNLRENLINATKTDENVLVLRKGAQVMFRVNALVHQLANGSRGVVVDFVTCKLPSIFSKGECRYPVVEFKNGRKFIIGPTFFMRYTHPKRWQPSSKIENNVIPYREGLDTSNLDLFAIPPCKTTNETYVYVARIPLTLAWALTSHKCQGVTLDCAKISFSNIWEPGQGYVLISRLRELDGLTLETFDRNSIFADPDVVEFYRNLEAAQIQTPYVPALR